MTRALVVGAGIAGTVTAIALRKAGFEVVINEAYQRGADRVGAIIGLQLNGMDALHCLGLDELVREQGSPILTRNVRLGSGRPLATTRVHGERATGPPSQLVKRADLYRVLRDEAIRRGVEVRYGKRLCDAENTATGVLARFEDGGTDTGDVLIGADGVRSRTREIIDPHAPSPRFTGMLDSSGCASGVRVDEEPGTINMIFDRKAFFAYLPQPDGDVWWFTHPPRRREPDRAELDAIPPDRWRAQLLELFTRDNSPAIELINATRTVFPPWCAYDFGTVPHWHRGRMIIVGDAAHAVSPGVGQGAALAMEDAVVLAKSLRDNDEVPTALRAYERLRRERVERIAAYGRKAGAGERHAGNPVRRVLRDLGLRIAMREGGSTRSARQWMFDHHLEWAR